MSLGLLVVRHLVSKWLEGIDNLPTRLEEVKDEMMDEINKLRQEITNQREHGDADVEGVRRYAETEFGRVIASGHSLREKVNLDIGVLSARVDGHRDEINELKGDVKDFREDLHRVDANVIMIASKLNVTPMLPGSRG